MLKEFKEFISRGSVIDLAIGVILGGAFNNIVSAFVNYIFMPIVGAILGGINFANLAIHFKSVHIAYGLFIQNIIIFIIMAALLFVFVKAMNELSRDKKKEEIPETELSILKEIRDELKNNTKSTTKTKKDSSK